MVKREIKAKTTFIRLPEVIKRTGFGKTWIYELIKAGRFPSQVKTGIRAVPSSLLNTGTTSTS
ncbi:AlpA family phage regulatory protein [Salmonella enterica subsp. enterica serovar Enteritidis]|nr:AlpA family phage regulatory protein [Salmonella enterica subsp. enterica serovar Enteritidis]